MNIAKALLIKNARVVTETRLLEHAWLHMEGGLITAIDENSPPETHDSKVVNARGLTLLPGFIDLHAHGGGGFDVMDGDPQALLGMARYFARGGTTAFLATTWTDSGERISKALHAIAEAQEMNNDGATLLGAHLEGPYLNAEKCGAQHIDFIRRASHHEALPWLDIDVIRLLSLAPEFPENHWLIEEADNRGITVSVAHSNADYQQIRFAHRLGLGHATHAFNAMSELHHRQPGVVGAMLSMDEITCELICDLEHVHPAAINILWRCKGEDGIILITDSVKIAGLQDGVYRFSHQEVEMKQGVVRIREDGSLAGTSLSMNAALRNLLSVTGHPLATLWKTASLNAARALNIEDLKGSIALGKDADLVLVDDALNVQLTVVAGRIVYERNHFPSQSMG